MSDDDEPVQLGEDVTRLFRSPRPVTATTPATLNLTGQRTDSAGRATVLYEVTPCS